MASVQTSKYDGRYLKLTVIEESTSIEDNTSILKWTLESIGGNSNYYDIYDCKVTINSTVVYGPKTAYWNGKAFPSAKGSTSGTLTVEHNPDGTASDISFTLRGSVKNNSPTNYNGTLSLSNIPRQADLLTAPDFNDESNPKITYNNPAGDTVTSLQACISLDGANDLSNATADINYRDITKTGTEYTFNLTTAERNVLRNNCTTSNSRTVVFIIKTVIGGNTFYSSLTKTLTIINATPTAGSLTYEDIDNTIVAITQNNQHIVRNNSSLRVSFGAATGNKGATISNYKISFNGSTETRNAAGYIDYGVVNISSNTTVIVVATDSRGNTVSVSKTITIFDWLLPSAVISLNRVNNYEDSTELKVQTTISSVNSKNAIMSIKYRFKKTSDNSYSEDTTINDNTEYTITKDKNYAWNFQIEIKDKFGTITYNLTLGKGTPILYIDIKNLAVGINSYPSSNDSLKIGGNTTLDGVIKGSNFEFHESESYNDLNGFLADFKTFTANKIHTGFINIGNDYGLFIGFYQSDDNGYGKVLVMDLSHNYICQLNNGTWSISNITTS